MSSTLPIRADYIGGWSGNADWIVLSAAGKDDALNIKVARGRRVELKIEHHAYASLAATFVERILQHEAHEAATTPSEALSTHRLRWTREELIERFSQAVAELPDSYFRR